MSEYWEGVFWVGGLGVGVNTVLVVNLEYQFHNFFRASLQNFLLFPFQNLIRNSDN